MLKKRINKRPPKNPILVKPNTRYLTLPDTASIDEFKVMGDMVQNKELKWSHFKVENGNLVHYYLKLKKKK